MQGNRNGKFDFVWLAPLEVKAHKTGCAIEPCRFLSSVMIPFVRAVNHAFLSPHGSFLNLKRCMKYVNPAETHLAPPAHSAKVTKGSRWNNKIG
jgi:hypothetical protein